MNELLSVVVDFNCEALGSLDLETFVGSLLKFLNCFRMQSGLNQSRIYLAFASNSFLVYPLESLQQDQSKMQSLAFDEVKNCLLERIFHILENEQLQKAEERSPSPNTTLVH